MASAIKLRRSAIQGAVPTTAQLELGELAINTYDGKLYLKKNVDGTESVAEIGAGGGGGGIATITGTAPLVSSGTSDITLSIPAATNIADGYMTSIYAGKLDGIAEGATNVTDTSQLTNTAGFITAASPAITSPTISYGTLNSSILNTPIIKGSREVHVALASSSVDIALGNYFSKTIAGATTFSLAGVSELDVSLISFILDLTNAGSAAVTWWSGVTWAGGSAPTLTAAGRDTLGFFTYDGGATWTGLVLGIDIK